MDLDGLTDRPPVEPLPPLQPITINEFRAGWLCAVNGYGNNIFPHDTPGCRFALTLRDIATRQLRLALLDGWQLAVIEKEPSTIDLRDRDEATRRLAKYAWFHPSG